MVYLQKKMNTNQLRKLFSESKNDATVKISDISDISKHVKVNVCMDSSTYDYYFSAKINDLAKYVTDDDIIYSMVKNGWCLSKDKNEVVKYC